MNFVKLLSFGQTDTKPPECPTTVFPWKNGLVTKPKKQSCSQKVEALFLSQQTTRLSASETRQKSLSLSKSKNPQFHFIEHIENLANDKNQAKALPLQLLCVQQKMILRNVFEIVQHLKTVSLQCAAIEKSDISLSHSICNNNCSLHCS